MEALDNLLKNKNWSLLFWDDRYQRGVWAVITPHINHAYEINQIAEGGDLESLGLNDYLCDEDAYLPLTYSNSLMEALTSLNEKVEQFQADADWETKVYNGFQAFLE